RLPGEKRAGEEPGRARGRAGDGDRQARSRAAAEGAGGSGRAGDPGEHGRPGDGGSSDRRPRDDRARRASAAGRDPGRGHAGEVLAYEGGRAHSGAPAGRAHRSGPRRVWLLRLRHRGAASQEGRRLALLAAIFTLLLVLGAPGLVLAQVYRWTDAEGTIHYTTDAATIPPAFRGNVRTIDTPTPGPIMVPPPPSSGVVVPYTGGPVRSEERR